ncbi:MAG: hypothetical protein P9F75_17950 [Candidatus Contendobacter sp.]|nr:hypothetical protein [Candidatus Contendobacter sp.]
MKDPLQKQPTPYEILSVSPDATAKEIDDAFKKGLGKSKNVKQKQDARQFLLSRPLDRALLNLFLYDDAVLEKLDPNPLHDPDALDVSQRAETASKWRKQFRGSTFPDPGIARALGILWYWSACQASEQFAETGAQSDGDISAWQDSWESAMGYWAYVATTPDFWAEKSPPFSLTQDDIRAGVQQRIASDLHRFTQLQRDAGHDDAADRFQQLEMDLIRELETAKTLLDAKAKINKKFICFGNLMLVRMRLVEQIVAYIDERLRNPPSNATKEHLDLLRKLKEDFSSYGNIAALIKNGRFEAAINQIESLSPSERELPEVLGFEAQARFQFGQQLASVNKLDEALACWERALQCAQSDNLRREIAEAAEAACINFSTQNPPRDEAIRVFESGFRIAPHSEKLRLRLADLLTQRGIEAVVEAKKKAEKEDPPSEKTIEMAERGIADLRRAAKELGSEPAAKPYKDASEVLERLKFPPEIKKLWEEANEAGGRQDWERAIGKLRKALRELALKQPNSRALNQLRKNLSVCLNNYSTDRFNVAASELVKMLAGAIDAARIPQGLEMLRVALTPQWKLLYSACTTLCEAIQLDPSNDHALQNLRGIEQQISQLESSIPTQLQPNDRQKPSISAGTLKILQEAYAALENEDWDQAADKFERAISQLGSQASKHLPREFPISAEAQQLLDEAYAARERKNWDEAIRKLEEAISCLGRRASEKIKKDCSDIIAQKLLDEAYAARERKNWDEAIRKFQKAISHLDSQASEKIKKDLEDVIIHKNLDEAYAAWKRKDWDEAIEKFRKAINLLGPRASEKIKKDLANVIAQRGMSYEDDAMQTPGLDRQSRLGRLYPARDDFNEAKKLDPSNDSVTKHLRYVEKAISGFESQLGKKFTVMSSIFILFNLFIFFLSFGVASYDQGSSFFYETYLPSNHWLLALRSSSDLGMFAASSATLVCTIGIYLLLFANWFSWNRKPLKAIFLIFPEVILGGWLFIFLVGLMYMPNTFGDQNRFSGRVAQNTAVTTSAKNRIPEKPVPRISMESSQQVLKQRILVDQVTTALMKIDSRVSDSASDQKLRTEIDILQKQLPYLSNETRSMTMLLIAAALESLGDQTAAFSYYARLIQGGGPYVATGKMRKSELDAIDPDKLEQAYKESLEKPATDGWFRTAGSWEKTTTHRAANLGLVDLRKDNISIRLLDWLRSNSLFPLPYAYFFALIVLAIFIKLIELPFLVTMIRINSILKPEIEKIRQENAGNLIQMNIEIAQLYKKRGINFKLESLRELIGILFAIWILLSLRAWVPQMELDGAKFFWITNIFKSSHSVIIVWVTMGLPLMILISKKGKFNQDSLITLITGSLMGLSLIIVPAIAWFFDWPAYMTIAWMLLWGISAGIQLILVLIITKLDLGRASGNFPPKADFVCKAD